jgi:hypothetical protein
MDGAVVCNGGAVLLRLRLARAMLRAARECSPFLFAPDSGLLGAAVFPVAVLFGGFFLAAEPLGRFGLAFFFAVELTAPGVLVEGCDFFLDFEAAFDVAPVEDRAAFFFLPNCTTGRVVFQIVVLTPPPAAVSAREATPPLSIKTDGLNWYLSS